MRKKHIYVGMDVHKETTAIALAHGGRGGEVEMFGTFSSGLDSMKKVLERLRRRKAVLHFAYESGPTGFWLQRRLKAWGEDCLVASASHVPKKAGDRVKTDRRDAILIAKSHRAGDLEAIYVPDAGDEAIRDLCRARYDAKQDERSNRQRLKSFLLRVGYKYTGKSGWTPEHKAYLREKQLPDPVQRMVVENYIQAIDNAIGRIEEIETQLQIRTLNWGFYGLASALMALRGVGWLTATCLAAELGDLRRFPSAASFMGYLGLCSSEHSSGQRRRVGSITKSGNSHVRFYVVESATHCKNVPKVSKELTGRQIGVDPEIVALSWKAQQRLHRRYWALVAGGSHPNVATVAVARELAGFIWAIGQKEWLYEDSEEG